ncbi:unnamed protein product [Polarella glacialis]|uniref:Uncharacterized protein n=1 Tax=Polarella glacialis TaxID=89957 RepID=A0A813HL38_POLGL|nr:unnamed protein product [Polarella glacialis]
MIRSYNNSYNNNNYNNNNYNNWSILLVGWSGMLEWSQSEYCQVYVIAVHGMAEMPVSVYTDLQNALSALGSHWRGQAKIDRARMAVSSIQWTVLSRESYRYT